MGPEDIPVNISVDFLDSIMTDGVEKVIQRMDQAIKKRPPW